MRRLATAIIIAAAAAFLVSCGSKAKVVRLAVAAPLTGDMATEGHGLRRAVELAVAQVNASKRFPYLVEVVPFDDRAEPKEAVNVAHMIVADPRIVAVIGHYNSGCAIPAARIYAQAGLPMITPSATHPDLTRQQLAADWTGPRIVFRIVPTDDIQAPAAAQFAFRRLKKRRIAVLHDGTPYGGGLAAEFKRVFVGLGGSVVFEETISPANKEHAQTLGRVGASQAEGIYFGGLYTEAGLLLKQMKKAGLGMVFISGDGARTPGLIDIAGEAVDGAYLTMVGTPVESLPGAGDFMAAYKARWDGEGAELKPFDHLGYEAAMILFAALERAGSDRGMLVEALRRTRHQGLLGLTAFDEKGDTLNRTITMTRAVSKSRSFPVVE